MANPTPTPAYNEKDQDVVDFYIKKIAERFYPSPGTWGALQWDRLSKEQKQILIDALAFTGSKYGNFAEVRDQNVTPTPTPTPDAVEEETGLPGSTRYLRKR